MDVEAPLDPDTERRLESFVGDWLVDADVPGASLAVLVDGDVAYTGGFGSRDLESNDPATPRTLYGVASVTKSFAATALLLLAERGELSLDDPVTAHLDDVDLEGAEDVTLHDLLTHSSGVPSLGVSEVLLYRLTGVEERGVPLGDREDVYRHLNGAGEEVTDPDGDRFMYCNTGYVLLGDVVAAASGTPFDAFVEREILDPLGMERSTFDPDATDDDAMTPYALEDGEPTAVPFPHRPASYAAGGLLSTVEELTRYLRLHQTGSVDGVELLPDDALERAHAGHVERDRGRYGYGWGRSTVRGRTLVGHGGSLGVASSYVGFTVDGAYAVAMAANATPSPTPPTVAKGVLAVLDGEDPHEAVPYFAREARFDELVGEYEAYRGTKTATVERDGNVLRLVRHHALGDEELVLLPADPDRPGERFEVPTAEGHRNAATFEVHDDHVDLFYDRDRLHRQR